MLMKLAISSDKAEKKIIKDCCELNKLEYLDIDEYKFGMLTDNPYESEFGQESDSDKNYNIKAFVHIYNCIKDRLDKKWSIFNRYNNYVYEGLLLDNLFFFNLIKYSKANKSIKLKSMEYFTEFKTPDTIYEYKDAEALVKYGDGINITKLSVYIGLGEEIIFNKNGYVELMATNIQFFIDNKEFIRNLLLVGISDNYGQ